MAEGAVILAYPESDRNLHLSISALECSFVTTDIDFPRQSISQFINFPLNNPAGIIVPLDLR